ncbi:MAG: 23S rRNA (uracil(1939)-C(5))-methyltransferase RlmD [Eubacterium sp.]|nr:23S rRNA (uracil(1939)-C(5))-methyltransferase RlmD [Eubacterium sp.]
MRKGDILTGTVLQTDFPNKGIIIKDDQKIIVKNALEGQTVRFSISKKRKDRLEGRLLEVLEPSDRELPFPACIHFGSCGGCAYQNLPYDEQLSLKRRQVEALIRQAGFDFSIEAIYGSPIHEGYRNKMEYTFGDEEKGGPLTLGMHKRNSFYDIVPLSDCRIVDPDFNLLLNIVLSYFKKEGKSYYHRMRHEGFLRHLVLRRSVKTGDILINLVTSSMDRLDEESFVQAILTAGSSIDGRIAGILHTINDSPADVVKSDETRLLYGQDYIDEYLFNMKFKISPFSFFQTNTLSAEILYDKVREYVGETRDKLIYDLYSGTGTIAQILAPVARKVVGVEIVEEAVEAAGENAAANGLANCEFIAGDVLKVVDDLHDKPDIIVLDPPRDGINPKALRKIISFGVKEMVYVSCKPTSLMRDLAVLMEAGYEVRRCCLVDQFPGTVHIETVVLLCRSQIS